MEEKSRNRRLQPYVHIALAVVAGMVLFLLIWTFAGPGNVRNHREPAVSESVQENLQEEGGTTDE